MKRHRAQREGKKTALRLSPRASSPMGSLPPSHEALADRQDKWTVVRGEEEFK